MDREKKYYAYGAVCPPILFGFTDMVNVLIVELTVMSAAKGKFVISR
jgi:hypothetical protein